MKKPMYKMSVVGNAIINPRWTLLEKEQTHASDYNDWKKFFESKEWELVKAFALCQNIEDPDDDWYVEVNFIEYDHSLPAPYSEYKVHIFPRYIPLRSIMSSKNNDLIQFYLDDDGLDVIVECDQRSAPGYVPGKWEDEDPLFNIDPFVGELSNAMYRRIYEPYKIDYVAEDAHRRDVANQIHTNLCKCFGIEEKNNG